jgi:hypothetical protein
MEGADGFGLLGALPSMSIITATIIYFVESLLG